jgi:two-component sensor histidine kinase
MSDSDAMLTREELEALHDKFREIKHSINNTLAVIMALSELAQRNPAHYEKLAKAVLQRGPEVVQQLQDFQTSLGAKLKGPEGASPIAAT